MISRREVVQRDLCVVSSSFASFESMLRLFALCYCSQTRCWFAVAVVVVVATSCR